LESESLSDVLSEFARTMVTDFPIQGILDHLVKRIVVILPITAAGVTLIAPGTGPRYLAASNASALRFERLQTELGEGPCVTAYQFGNAVSVPDLRNEDRFPTFTARALTAGLSAVFSFPLRHGDRQLGALDLYRDSSGALSTDFMSSAQTLADVAAAYVLNAQARADLQLSSDRSAEAALHDPLTGLPNRVLALTHLDHALLRQHRTGKLTAVLFVDLDHFKAVNDTYGHQLGDDLLVAVVERLTRVLRTSDTLARLSGDEFLILCEDLDGPSQADAIVARVHSELASPFTLSETKVRITASVGIALSEHGKDAPDQLMRDADLAMYGTKRRNVSSRPAGELTGLHHAENSVGLERALSGAAGRGELHLDYQPIVAAADGRITGAEALLRWTHPTLGKVSPRVLISLAEQSGQIVDIGKWVLERASEERNRWQTPRADGLAVSINISAHQLMSADFTETVAAALDDHSLDAGSLTLEVTETVFVRDRQRALLVLNDLKDLGVMLALDDFGTGYSSLSYLMTYPIDTIKVDSDFVANLGRNAASDTIVSAVIELAHGLGMSVVAEGVETPSQQRRLAGLGCDFCQGFYFARPMSVSSLDTLIRRGNGSPPPLPARPA
jgi:diguanylate cyclase (GGDEF)-like protein